MVGRYTLPKSVLCVFPQGPALLLTLGPFDALQPSHSESCELAIFVTYKAGRAALSSSPEPCSTSCRNLKFKFVPLQEEIHSGRY